MASDAIDGPALTHPGHAQDRGLSVVAGSARAWRNRDESALSAYAARGLLEGGNYTTAEREAAGDHYRKLWETVMRSTRDSTQLDIVQNGSGLMITEAMADATRELILIDRNLSQNDRRIVRRVCCENWHPAQAVREVDLGYKDKTVARFREAMTALVGAISTTRVARAREKV